MLQPWHSCTVRSDTCTCRADTTLSPTLWLEPMHRAVTSLYQPNHTTRPHDHTTPPTLTHHPAPVRRTHTTALFSSPMSLKWHPSLLWHVAASRLRCSRPSPGSLASLLSHHRALSTARPAAPRRASGRSTPPGAFTRAAVQQKPRLASCRGQHKTLHRAYSVLRARRTAREQTHHCGITRARATSACALRTRTRPPQSYGKILTWKRSESHASGRETASLRLPLALTSWPHRRTKRL